MGVARSGHDAERVEEVARARHRDRPEKHDNRARGERGEHPPLAGDDEHRGHEPDQLRLEEQRHEQQTREHWTAMIERLDGEDRREQHEAVRLTEKDPGSGFE